MISDVLFVLLGVAIGNVVTLGGQKLVIKKLINKHVKKSDVNYDTVFNLRSDAEKVFDTMNELLDDYEMVSVADLYDLTGITCSFSDNKIGWKNLSKMKIYTSRHGYTLTMPRVITLN